MMRSLLLLSALLAATGCDDDVDLNVLNFGSTAIVTGDFDTVEQLIKEVSQETAVAAELSIFDGYISEPHFEHDVDVAVEFAGDVEDLLRGDAYDDDGIGRFDTIFFSDGMRGVNVREYNGVVEDDHLVSDDTVVANVREQGELGRRLYFSDWTYDLMERAWPDLVDWVGDDTELDAAQRGTAQIVSARVVDEGLAAFMEVPEGSEIEVEFNYGVWAVAETVSDDVNILVEADVEIDDPVTGEYRMAMGIPLVFSATVGQGVVIFTSYHNEAQISEEARDVLRYQLGQLSN
jgi:hypothetical protein